MNKSMVKAKVLKAALKTEAYKSYLKALKFNIHKNTAWNELPVTDKSGFITKFKQSELFSDSNKPYFIYSSSGSSGKSTYWYRSEELDYSGLKVHQNIFKNTFGVNTKDSTLVLVCFSMGVWIAGIYTMDCMRLMAKNGWNVSTITPGLDKESILEAVKTLAPKYKNIVLAGHPPFIMHTLEFLKSNGVDFSQNYFILTAGDKISETWRDTTLKILGKEGHLNSIVNLYGASDVGTIAYETSLSIKLRRLAKENELLREKLFSGVSLDPAIFQYDPDLIYLEEIDNQIVITSNSAIPLVRYNIKDIGRIFSNLEIQAILEEINLLTPTLKKELLKNELPFVIKGGRSDVALTYYAMNLYPEQLIAWREKKDIAKATTGTFSVFKKTDKEHKKESLEFLIELTPNLPKKIANLKDRIKHSVTESLRTLSPEFRKMLSTLGKSAEPKLAFVSFGESVSPKNSTTGIIFTEGKKPKIFS